MWRIFGKIKCFCIAFLRNFKKKKQVFVQLAGLFGSNETELLTKDRYNDLKGIEP